MSENHRRIGTAWRTAHDRRVGPDPTCHYLGRLPDACTGAIQRHHVVELADGGHPLDTTPACEGHHKMVTRINRDARRKPPRQAPRQNNSTRATPERQKPATPTPHPVGHVAPPRLDMSTIITVHRWAVGLSIAAVGIFWLLDMSGAMSVIIGAWIVYIISGSYVALTIRQRRRERSAITTLTVRTIKCDPAFIRVRRMRWQWTWGLKAQPIAGRVDFPDVETLHDQDARNRVEAAFAKALRATVTWPAHALRPHFDWSVSSDPIPAHSPDGAIERIEEKASDDEKIRTVIEDDLHKSMRLKKDQSIKFDIVNRDEEGPVTCVLQYPAGFQDGSSEARYLVQERISAQYGGIRFIAEWDRRAESKKLTLTRRPPIPAKVPFKFPENEQKIDPKIIPLGIDENFRERSWNLYVHPHMIFAGPTGSGKSYSLAEIVYQLLIRGWELILIDGKGTTFAPFRKWRGVVGYGLANSPESMAHWMDEAKRITEDRYDKVIDRDADPDQFPRLMVIIDELTEANELIAEWWRQERLLDPKMVKECPSIGAWASVARKGREGGVHLLVATQQPNASDTTLGSTETRANLAGRFFLGPTEQQSALMMFGRSDIGRDIPESTKGRGTLKVSPEEPGVEIQTYYVPRPKPSGAISPEDSDFFDRLMPLIHDAQARIPAALSSAIQQPQSPVASIRTIGIDDLSILLEDTDAVHVTDIESGEHYTIVGIDEGPRITYLTEEGQRAYEDLSEHDDPRFQIREAD